MSRLFLLLLNFFCSSLVQCYIVTECTGSSCLKRFQNGNFKIIQSEFAVTLEIIGFGHENRYAVGDLRDTLIKFVFSNFKNKRIVLSKLLITKGIAGALTHAMQNIGNEHNVTEEKNLLAYQKQMPEIIESIVKCLKRSRDLIKKYRLKSFHELISEDNIKLIRTKLGDLTVKGEMSPEKLQKVLDECIVFAFKTEAPDNPVKIMLLTEFKDNFAKFINDDSENCLVLNGKNLLVLLDVFVEKYKSTIKESCAKTFREYYNPLIKARIERMVYNLSKNFDETTSSFMHEDFIHFCYERIDVWSFEFNSLNLFLFKKALLLKVKNYFSQKTFGLYSKNKQGLSSILRPNPTKYLEIVDCFVEVDAFSICHFKNSSLQQVIFERNTLDSKVFVKFLQALPEDLQELSVISSKQTGEGSEYVKIFAEDLSRFKQLTALSLRDCGLASDKDFQLIDEILAISTLKRLSLSQNNIANLFLSKLSRHKGNSKLKYLGLAQEDTKNIAFLENVMNLCKLKKLAYVNLFQQRVFKHDLSELNKAIGKYRIYFEDCESESRMFERRNERIK